MITYNELLKTPEYWITKIQLDLYTMMNKYMESNNLSRTDLAKKLGVTKGYISQVLNGDFDHRLSKLVELSMSVGMVPQINFIPVDKVFVKETKVDQDKVLELIDGQQRLTTLSILIAVATNNLKELDFASDKLDYEVRGDFFQTAIHSKLQQYLEEDWEEPGEFSQDKHYIISASQKINNFIK